MIQTSNAIAKEFLTKKVVTIGDAYNFLNACITWLGPGFHPDTNAIEYINMRTNKLVFSKATARKYNRNMNEVFKLLPDPYALCIDVMRSRGFDF